MLEINNSDYVQELKEQFITYIDPISEFLGCREFEMFEPINYHQDLVKKTRHQEGGMIYQIKVRVSEDEYIHAKVN